MVPSAIGNPTEFAIYVKLFNAVTIVSRLAILFQGIFLRDSPPIADALLPAIT